MRTIKDKTTKKKRKTKVVIGIGIISLLCVAAGGLYYWCAYRKTANLYKEEKDYINEYLEKLNELPSTDSETNKEIDAETVTTSGEGVMYDGVVDCVLDIPRISLNKLVIKGNNDYNLEKYLLVTAYDTIQFGEKAYMIFGHNSYINGVSFGRLHELEIGDTVYITNSLGRFEYKVTELYSLLNAEINDTLKYDNPNWVYLYTCEKSNRAGESERRLHIVKAEMVEPAFEVEE